MAIQVQAHPFAADAVEILDESLLARRRRNTQYLLSLDPDRLLHTFRLNADLPSRATPLGGWESPDHGLRGHFVGHYLSAVALTHATTRDPALRHRIDALVTGLAECQRALHTGYLGAFPESHLTEIETRFTAAWASYYVIQKILSGLIDAHRHAGNPTALEMATALADRIADRIDRLPAESLDRILRTDTPNPTNETGAWAAALHDLYALTPNDRYLNLAARFLPEWFLAPLARHQDPLTGLHANTHIPLVIGALRHAMTTSPSPRPADRHPWDPNDLLRAAKHFWTLTALARSYVTGGSSGPRPDHLEKSTGAEHWPAASRLSNTLTPKICESCVTHNMLRLTDLLFQLSPDPKYPDFHERAFLNSVLTMQHPERPGAYLYDHPLSPNSRKTYGTPDASFWCCYGSTTEAYAHLAAGAYYHADDALWINQRLSSRLTWPRHHLTLEQSTPHPGADTTRLTLHLTAPAHFTLHLRIPAWTGPGATVALNGRPLDTTLTPATFLPVTRTWHDRDILTLDLRATPRCEPMPDDPTTFALLHGAHVLAARTDAGLTVPARDTAAAVAHVRPEPADPRAFSLAPNLSLVPLNRITDEAFGVYFHLTPEPA